MKHLDLDAIARTALTLEPFPHLLVSSALHASSTRSISDDYPAISKPGSFMLDDVAPGPAVHELISEFNSDIFRHLLERKLSVDLKDRQTIFSFRGVCSTRDGKIHNDSRSKIVSVLLYLNEAWRPTGGRLRLLRNGFDIEDYSVEIPPTFGQMLLFERSEVSWHGHKSFIGPRRVLQMNYVRSQQSAFIAQIRHRVSALAKRYAH
jgi:hypothetical protein